MGTTLSVLIFYLFFFLFASLFFRANIRYDSTMSLSLKTIPSWEQLVAALQQDFPNLFDETEQLASVHPESWVARYERLQRLEAQKSRKAGHPQNGVFYTPMPIAQYLIQQTLGKQLAQQAEVITQALQQDQENMAYQALQQAQYITLIDPACGTGVFLVAALQAFHQFYEAIPLFYKESCKEAENGLQHALQHQLFGIDLDPLSVQITQARLAQWATILNPKQAHLLPQNLVSGDTLTLNVQQQFSLQHWTFVVGNPPYLSEVRKQASRFKSLQKGSAYYQAKMDLCDAFLAWAIEHTAQNGQLAYVLPEYWTQRTSTQVLRKQLVKQGQIQEFWRFSKPGIFKNAPGHHTSLLIWQNAVELSENAQSSMRLGQISNAENLSSDQLESASYRLDESSGKLLFGNLLEMQILEQLSQRPPLLQPNQIQQGIVLPQGRVDAQRQSQAGLTHPGIFLLTDDEIESMKLNDAECALLKPFYLPTHFEAFHGFSTRNSEFEPDFWLVYIDAKTRKLLEVTPEAFPNLIAHLQHCASVNTSAFAPYGLHRGRQKIWFESTHKILSPRQVMQPTFATVKQLAYVGEGFYIIQPQPEDCAWMIAVLNSSLAWFWFYQQKRKGDRLQIDKDVLCAFPQPQDASPSRLSKLAHWVNVIQASPSREQNQDLHRQIDNLVYQIYGLSLAESSFIQQARHNILGLPY